MADRLAQLLGVVALVATDRFRGAIEASLGHGGAHAAALVHLAAHPGEPVGRLADVLGVSQPAAVKIADRLAAEDLLERRPGSDRRSVALHLTAAGHRTAARLLADRGRELGDLVAVLDAGERRQFERLLERIVSGLADDLPEALRCCRLCDRDACYRPGRDCPLDHTKS
jgi:DNA-binding MarR family transcriptional regulator